MTIYQVIRKRLKRYALYCMMAAAGSGLVSTATVANAENTHDGSPLCGLITQLSECASGNIGQTSAAGSRHLDHSSTAFEEQTPQFLSIKVDDELTIDTCNYGEWLANHVPVEIDGQTQSGADPILHSRTSGHFDSALATLAAAASAGSPIPLTHLTEPFAMIGPDGSHSPKEIEAFQNWFAESKSMVAMLRNDAIRAIAATEFVPLVDFSGELSSTEPDPRRDLRQDSQAASAPVSVELELPHALRWQNPSDRLVGGSAVIVTIKEDYSPYDMADSDRERLANGRLGGSQPELDPSLVADRTQSDSKTWADGGYVSPLQPFCIRSLESFRQPGWGPLAPHVIPLEPARIVSKPAGVAPVNLASVDVTSVDVTSVDVAVDPPAETVLDVSGGYWATGVCGSPDCWLEEWVWQIGVNLEDVQVPDEWLRPERIGREFASLVVSGDRIASHWARELALVWPAAAMPVNPIPGSGAKLLARAEAAEQLPEQGLVDSLTQQQLAQAGAIVRQWVDVAQSVFDDFSVRLIGVTEVARNRGTQNDANLR